MYAKFIPIFAVESFVLFSFTGDYLNLEMFKIFYLLGVYQKDVYFCMIFSFVFFFSRDQCRFPQAPFKKLNILPLVIYMVHDQGRIQDFKLEGGALKKIAPSGGRREKVWGISCEKSRFYAKIIFFFRGGGGGARRVRPPLDPPLMTIHSLVPLRIL